MVLLAGAASAASVLMILFPVAWAAEQLSSKVFHFRRLAEIPLASGLLLAYLGVVLLGLVFARGWTLRAVLPVAVTLALVQFVLMGVYWWALQGTRVVQSVPSKILTPFRSRGRIG
jgi:hypothetical protein